MKDLISQNIYHYLVVNVCLLRKCLMDFTNLMMNSEYSHPFN